MTRCRLAYAAIGLCAAAATMMSGAAAARSVSTTPTVPLEVDTAQGAVRGIIQSNIASWKGIRFAAPPVGANRWRAPQPIRWTGVKDASSFGHDCMQHPFPTDATPLGTAPSEDCLVLNVWRPASATSTNLPVLVWIYGGGFVNGGASPALYDGSKFAAHGLVFVSFNYRLGRFGFFAHPALTAAHEGPIANYGIMDQIEALRWVRRNIGRFGGDPRQVTVFGESAGGASTLTLLTSPAARGLFSRVAVMSGGGRQGFFPPRRAEQDLPGLPSAQTIGVHFARGVGIEGSGAAALTALRRLPAAQVLQGLDVTTMTDAMMVQATYDGGPVIDGAIVPGTLQQGLDAGAQARVPVLIGSTGADIAFSRADSLEAVFQPFGDQAGAARRAYGVKPGDPPGPAAHAVAMDIGMTEPARLVAAKTASAGQGAFLYRFDYVASSMRNRWGGAPHASDIPFVFDTVSARYGNRLAPADAAVARAINAYFANFARDGDPNGPGLVHWPRFDPATGQVMRFTMNEGIIDGPDPWRHRLDMVAALAGTSMTAPARRPP